MYFKLAHSKRGCTCSMCKKSIEKGKKYFNYFQYDKNTMKYPINEKFCFECASEVSNPEFLRYVEKLIKTLYGLKTVMFLESRKPKVQETLF